MYRSCQSIPGFKDAIIFIAIDSTIEIRLSIMIITREQRIIVMFMADYMKYVPYPYIILLKKKILREEKLWFKICINSQSPSNYTLGK